VEELKKSVERVEEKLDKVSEELSQIRVVQAEQAADLKHHIRRTEASEVRIEMVEERLLPLVEFKHKLDGAFLLIGKIGSGLALIFAAVKTIEVLMELF
jgi:DNA repair ATPase RecN